MASSQHAEDLAQEIQMISTQCEDMRRASDRIQGQQATLKADIDTLTARQKQLPSDDERALGIADQISQMKDHWAILTQRYRQIAAALAEHEQHRGELQQQLDDMKAVP